MSNGVRVIRESFRATPTQVYRAWPRTRYLAALMSSPFPQAPSRWAKWSILTSPVRVLTLGAEEADPIGRLEVEIEQTRLSAGELASLGHGLPFAGGWFVAMGYELGRRLEPKVGRGERRNADWPWDVVMWRCPWALMHDHQTDEWTSVQRLGVHGGSMAQGTKDGYKYEVLYSATGCCDQLEQAQVRVGEPRSQSGEEVYQDAVARGVEYIHAGDIFQTNLTHTLRAGFEGSTRAMFARMMERASPWYGAYLELAQEDRLHAALSVSPELFLSHHAATRGVTTRPIKGTKRSEHGASSLEKSVKDQAELNMIVDLMRNDLGRVCQVGTVRVPDARVIELHGMGSGGGTEAAVEAEMGGAGGVLHGVATVQGRLRGDRTIGDLLRATFPGGSITGAPKVRAMQIIEELEPSARGLYTGAIGYISDCGNMTLNIAIRTAVVSGERADPLRRFDEVRNGTLSYGVGAGIVADSDPASEWEETLAKAGVLMDAARMCGEQAARSHDDE